MLCDAGRGGGPHGGLGQDPEDAGGLSARETTEDDAETQTHGRTSGPLECNKAVGMKIKQNLNRV